MIFGERIRLRAMERADVPLFVPWINDPEVRAGIGMYLPVSLISEESWFENMLKGPEAEHPLMIEVKEGEGWVPIGNIAVFGINWRLRSSEIGILIGDRSYWNKGFGTEAMQLILKHGFETLNLHRMYLRVFQTNPRAVRAYEKAGFVHEGVQRQAEFRDGKYVDVLMMSVLVEEWQARQ
jgi:RimJ/RimL family protein N-acetyltransferase